MDRKMVFTVLYTCVILNLAICTYQLGMYYLDQVLVLPELTDQHVVCTVNDL